MRAVVDDLTGATGGADLIGVTDGGQIMCDGKGSTSGGGLVGGDPHDTLRLGVQGASLWKHQITHQHSNFMKRSQGKPLATSSKSKNPRIRRGGLGNGNALPRSSAHPQPPSVSYSSGVSG